MEDNKRELISRLEDYKNRMIDFFIFNKKSKAKFEPIKNEIISINDWPLDGNICKDGPIWRVASGWVVLHKYDYQINLGRWTDLHGPEPNKKEEEEYLEKLLEKYTATIETNNVLYDPSILAQYPQIDVDSDSQKQDKKKIPKNKDKKESATDSKKATKKNS